MTEIIEVSKVSEIPIDYDGVMAVPITFMEKYNPEQFEIISQDKVFRGKINGKEKYCRILIKNKFPLKKLEKYTDLEIFEELKRRGFEMSIEEIKK